MGQVFRSNYTTHRYDVEAAQVQVLSVMQAAHGGSFGQAPGTFIAVHRDDLDRADEVQKNVFHL